MSAATAAPPAALARPVRASVAGLPVPVLAPPNPLLAWSAVAGERVLPAYYITPVIL